MMSVPYTRFHRVHDRGRKNNVTANQSKQKVTYCNNSGKESLVVKSSRLLSSKCNLCEGGLLFGVECCRGTWEVSESRRLFIK